MVGVGSTVCSRETWGLLHLAPAIAWAYGRVKSHAIGRVRREQLPLSPKLKSNLGKEGASIYIAKALATDSSLARFSVRSVLVVRSITKSKMRTAHIPPCRSRRTATEHIKARCDDHSLYAYY